MSFEPNAGISERHISEISMKSEAKDVSVDKMDALQTKMDALQEKFVALQLENEELKKNSTTLPEQRINRKSSIALRWAGHIHTPRCDRYHCPILSHAYSYNGAVRTEKRPNKNFK